MRAMQQKEASNKKADSEVNGSVSKMHEKDYNEETSSDVTESNSGKSQQAIESSETNNLNMITCPECPKIFPTPKALYGHLRSHPERAYRGANKPVKNLKRRSNQTSTVTNWRRSNPTSTVTNWQQSNPTSTVTNWGLRAKRGRTTPEEFAAQTLLIISETVVIVPVKRPEESPKGSKTYQCNICDRTFASHQALGGHRASHNKKTEPHEGVTENGVVQADARAATAIEHKCKVCSEVFATGQALGGHMRRHYNGPPLTGNALENVGNANENENVENVERGNRGSRLFDLNEYPPQFEEVYGAAV
ncbi:uncharacterized protein A4U43_C05F21290 [Asparagus officinalis]|uniref:C2H2-type domain-containing protein n=1 Tax=Asparagus officinalis TaxID=4686 RepID=A0A5P1EXE5_ASPOF|nr:zinc finger protein ZAT2-like [Asparagus officinalis]ONK69289.1 uncharacterized protein A4U43_C05F21290 [Asparagus officinalis]